MNETKCIGNCPNTCKAHMGEFEFCTNPGCKCHHPKLPCGHTEAEHLECGCGNPDHPKSGQVVSSEDMEEMARDIGERIASHESEQEVEDRIRETLDEAQKRKDLGENWAVAELVSLVSNLLAQQKRGFAKKVGEIRSYEEARRKGHMHPKWNEAKKDSIETLDRFLSLLTQDED